MRSRALRALQNKTIIKMGTSAHSEITTEGFYKALTILIGLAIQVQCRIKASVGAAMLSPPLRTLLPFRKLKGKVRDSTSSRPRKSQTAQPGTLLAVMEDTLTPFSITFCLKESTRTVNIPYFLIEQAENPDAEENPTRISRSRTTRESSLDHAAL